MYLQWVEVHFVCACSVNFSLMRKTAGMRLRRFAKKKKQENNSGSSTWDNFRVNFSLCNLDGSDEVFKLLCGVWKEFILKKGLYKRLRVFSCDCLGDGCRWCYLRRMQEACRRAQTNWIVTFLSCYYYLKLIIWSTHFPVSVFQSFNCTASAMYFQFTPGWRAPWSGTIIVRKYGVCDRVFLREDWNWVKCLSENVFERSLG